MTFYEWFIGLCVKNEKSVAEVVKEIGVSSASASGWKYGSQPKATTLFKLEKYFGEKYEKEKSPASEDTELDSDSIKILELLHQLTPENSVRAIAYIQGLVDTQ